MANIPGISGFIQPGAFARDRVLSRGVSIPGGVRIVCVMGEGLREETVVTSAAGSGQDGSSDVNPAGGGGDGRYFKLNNAPVISGRTELRLNGTLLFGKEEGIDEKSFDSGFDFRLDPTTGHFELQGASIADQDGKGYSAGSMNIGNGALVENDDCDPLLTLDILDETAPQERWTIRCVSVVRDSNGDPIPGLATFTAIGSESGQLYDSSGSAIIFNSSYYSSGDGAVSANEDACTDGFVVEAGSGPTAGSVLMSNTDETPQTVSSFVVPGNLVKKGQALPGDHLCVDGYIGIEIEDLEYNDVEDETIISLVTDSLLTTTAWDENDTYGWDIRATNLLIDDDSVLHDGVDGLGDPDGTPAIAGSFTSADIGKTVLVCQGGTGGFAGGLYTVSQVTSSRRLRVHQIGDDTAGFPDAQDIGSSGLASAGLTFHMLQDNGILLLGIQEGSVPFEVGDKFFVRVKSRSLAKGDTLGAQYIYEADLEDPQLFTEANDLFTKHGFATEENTLSLGSQLVYENGAPAILALQCKPPVPRRTSVTLLEKINSIGEGGFAGCYDGVNQDSVHCEVDDLRFLIPRPTTGLRNGRPDPDSRVNIFIVSGKDGSEAQVFPNKVDFYQSQLETDIQQGNWIGSSDNSFSYTIVNASDDFLENGDAGEINTDAGGEYFMTPEVDFDASHIGMTIVITNMDSAIVPDTTYTSAEDIGDQLDDPAGLGPGLAAPELVISSIGDDSKVYVEHPVNGESLDLISSYSNVQFFIKDTSAEPDDALLLLHTDLVSAGVLKEGDGLRISYVDENDADYFDTNWFNALEALEAAEAQIIVPLPSQAISSIFRATVNHCENMSSIANRKERVAFIGAQIGVTPDALTGRKEIAIEDIGVLEGIQGDDPEEILDGNVEDLVNFKLSDNYTSNRCVYFYPDSIVRNVAGTNIALHGFYMGAAAAGYLSAKQNVAIPLTNKALSGFALTRDKVFRQVILNSLGAVGATVLQPVTGGGIVLAGRTTSQSGYVEDEEISIIFIRDAVKKILRGSLKGYIGGVQSSDTNSLISARVGSIMSAMVSQGLVTAYKNVRVEQDKVDPRQINVYLQFSPAYPINYVFIDIEVGVI
jgi:hypothetical protein